MADSKFGLKIGLEGEKEFKRSLSEINQSFKVLGSEMKLVDSQFDKNDTSTEALTERNRVLGKQIDAQKQKIEILRSALQNAASSFGENDRRTQAWQIQLNNAQAALNGMEKELRQNEAALDGTADGMSEAAKGTDRLGDELKSTGKESDETGGKLENLGKVCTAVGVAVTAACAAIAAAAVSAGKALIQMSVDGAAFADGVLTESTVTGIATDKLQEYMYAAELVDVSTETLTKSMAKQIKSMKAVQDGTKLSVEAYEKLGVTVLDADGNLRDSDTVYWEVIDALGKLENETERDALGMQILGKSAQELNPLITAGAARMAELGKQAQAAGYVISEDMLNAYGALDDQIQYLKVGCVAAKNALGTVLLPVLTKLGEEGVDLLGKFTNAILGANGDIGIMSENVAALVPDILATVEQYIPTLLSLIGSLLGAVLKLVVDSLPALVNEISSILTSVLGAIITALPQVVDAVLHLIGAVTETVLNNLPDRCRFPDCIFHCNRHSRPDESDCYGTVGCAPRHCGCHSVRRSDSVAGGSRHGSRHRGPSSEDIGNGNRPDSETHRRNRARTVRISAQDFLRNREIYQATGAEAPDTSESRCDTYPRTDNRTFCGDYGQPADDCGSGSFRRHIRGRDAAGTDSHAVRHHSGYCSKSYRRTDFRTADSFECRNAGCFCRRRAAPGDHPPDCGNDTANHLRRCFDPADLSSANHQHSGRRTDGGNSAPD